MTKSFSKVLQRGLRIELSGLLIVLSSLPSVFQIAYLSENGLVKP